ncbi:MAG: tetratricopeptide repeat protein, partial [Candidatus Paceibacterota bacterium]
MEKAREQFLKVIGTGFNNRLRAEAYYNLSSIAFYGSSTDSIKQSYDYASSSLEIDPTYSFAYLALGRAYVAGGDYKKAGPMLDNAIELYQDLSMAYEWRGNMYVKMGKLQDAIIAYEAEKKAALVDMGLMENERKNFISNAAFNQADLYARTSQKEKAVIALQEVIDNADPMTLLVTQFSLKNASANNFKVLVGYKPFSDLLTVLDKKVKDELTRLKASQPTSYLDKIGDFLNLIKPKKAIAAVSSCGATSAGTISVQNNGGSAYETSLANFFCSVLIEHLNGDDRRLNEAILVAKAADPLARGGLCNGSVNDDPWCTGYIAIGGSFLGCANGVGATFVPVAQSISPSGTLSCNATSATLSWTAVTDPTCPADAYSCGSIYYNLYFNDYTHTGWNGCSVPYVGDGCWIGYSATSVNTASWGGISIQNGHSYLFTFDAMKDITYSHWVPGTPRVEGYWVPESGCVEAYVTFNPYTYHPRYCANLSYWVPAVEAVPGYYTYTTTATKISDRATYFQGSSCATGVCGSANGKTYSSQPTTNLCSVGTASTVAGSGPWTWTCAGVSGGSSSPTCTAYILPTVTLANSSVNLSTNQATVVWSSTNANTCTASASPANGNWNGSKNTSGTQSFVLSTTTTFTLSCTGNGGTTSTSKQLIPVFINFNGSVANNIGTLNWLVTGETICTASGDGWNGTVLPIGSTTTLPVTTDQSYTLACGNQSQTLVLRPTACSGFTDSYTTSCGVTSNRYKYDGALGCVHYYPECNFSSTFGAQPAIVQKGGACNLVWSSLTSDATACYISNSINSYVARVATSSTGTLSSNVGIDAGINGQTTFTLSCGNGLATSTAKTVCNTVGSFGEF